MSRDAFSTEEDRGGRECVVYRVSSVRAGETIAHVLNRAPSGFSGSDMAVVMGDLELPSGWLERLSATAAGESTSATVSGLDRETFADAAEQADVGTATLVLEGPDVPRPRTVLAGGACVYITRAAFDLLGGMDETLPSSSAAVADFGLRARQLGLANLLAGDLVIGSDAAAELTRGDRDELARRFPALWQAAQEPPSTAVERSRGLVRLASRRISVTVDARSLSAAAGGTQLYTLELIRRLAATGDVRVRALVGPDPDVASQLGDLENTSVITYEQALAEPVETDLIHRPQQIFTADDLALLGPLGRRLIVTQLDLIAYHNPTYFAEQSDWERHVRATRIALAIADHVVFLSAHSLRDAEREELVDPRRTSVVPLGVNPDTSGAGTTQRPPALAQRDQPFLLCLGANYRHKNRPFALKLTAELRRIHGWDGLLVLAGARVEHGSSAAEEREVVEHRPELAGAVVELGPVIDSERRWLMSHARAIVYPSVLEGFGLVPFEAAAVGVPCLFAAQSSLAELIPQELATLTGWDLERCGTRAIGLLSDDARRARHIEGLRRAAAEYTWELSTTRTLQAYGHALTSHVQRSARQAWEALSRESEIVRLDQAVRDLQVRVLDLQASLAGRQHGFGSDAAALVGPDGLLSSADQRALLAIAVRPALRRPLFASARAGYRLAARRGASK